MILLLVLLLSGAARAQPSTGTAHAEPPISVAGSVVRSKEWIVRRGKSREEEFIGDVRYDAAGTKLSADWALYRQGPNDWRARGNIYLRKEFSDGDVVETRGETAWYDQDTLKGRLEPPPGGRVPLLRTPPQGAPDHADGDHLTWIGERTGTLSGRAHGWGPRAEFWADAARYDRFPSGQGMVLSGNRPLFHDFTGGKDAAVKADRIAAFDSPRRADMTGRARGWMLYQSSAAPAGADEARCGRGDRSEGPGPDAQVSALLSPLGPVRADEEESRFWEAESAAFAARACPWGPRVEFWADEAHDDSRPAAQNLILSGNRPALHYFTGEDDAALKADRIVAFDSPRRALVTGRAIGWILSSSSAAPAGADAARCGPSKDPGPDARVSALLSPLGAGRSADEEGRFWEAEAVLLAARACPGPRAEFWADKADYEESPDRRLTLSGGRPVLQKIDDHRVAADDHSMAIKADQIVAFGSRRVVATGKVKGWMLFEKHEKKRADKNKKASQEKTK